MRHAAWATAPLLLLAGCGFHLRGQTPLPAVVASPFVETEDHYSPLYAALDARLRAAGATPAADAATATAVIRLHVDDSGRELLSVTAENKPGEYEVYAAHVLGIGRSACSMRLARALRKLEERMEAHAVA